MSHIANFLDELVPDVGFLWVDEAAVWSEKIGLIARRGFKNALKSSPNVLLAMAALTFSY